MSSSEANTLQFFFVYFSYGLMMFFGYLREFVSKLLRTNVRVPPKGYAPLLEDYEYFYTRRIFQRARACWDRPITGVPGAYIDVLERASNDENSTFFLTGKKIRSLNLGSYNYLGFASKEGPVLEDAVSSLGEYGVATTASMNDGGYTSVHKELEETTARYVGKPAALIFEMGFATNSTSVPALLPKGSLVISDSLNHASLVMGCKGSDAKIKVFKHNDYADLERVVRQSIVDGQPRTRRPWSLIMILVEGIYSMEGAILNLPEVVKIKKKYKCHLYVDEAHSIGALGSSGRGVCDYWGVNTADVDILMGTFTKSFGSVGGYIAGSKELIARLRQTSFGSVYANSMSPACAQQALSSLKVIMGENGNDDGQKRIQRLRDNSNFFRKGLQEMGFIIFGDDDSPIIPLMIYHPAKLLGFSGTLLNRGIAIVVVGFPATDLVLSRARFCISAAHTREDLEFALKEIAEVGDMNNLKYNKYSIL